MTRTGRADRLAGDRFAFTIEEISTVNFEDIPEAND